ncbi:uncharacterized protein PV09_04876 [Verruconis gallopava]|uniref:FHA domain-containing protein n=1 Tax=Verruconis gallopava TaxID=253628 RepID=A0A0D2AB99_9PEZI|nr:uncharacterized protein PV09_04876 [Verruconis gallopava]KIW04058.1 hypothetical protein PV09_04876 [Verruconis gallopava]
MTAVAHLPNLQPINRTGWSGSNGANNGLNTTSTDDVSRMLMPRKTAQRSNSSSSLNSLASSSSTTSTTSTQSASSVSAPKTNGVNGAVNGDWGARKRTARGIWQPSKSEPISGITTARPQSINSATSGPSAASAISALHNPNGMSLQGQPDTQQNGSMQLGKSRQNEKTAVLYLTPMNGTFERKTINVPFYPDVLRIGRQTNNKTVPTPTNGFFDSKVLSRQHAEIWADRNGKIWIRDVKSSNGTFVNGQRLSQENKDSDPHELREQDMLELGIDIVSEDQKTVVHHKVAARVEHAGFYEPNSVLDLNFGDLDSSATSSLLGGNIGQALGQMRRSNSNSSINSTGRVSIGSATTSTSNIQQRVPHFWLAPVNMDRIIQKLNAECKAAKQQSLDLQRAQQHIDAILSAESQSFKKDSSQKTSPIEKSKGKDSFRARFSDPPAPPPQAPLPEKPDAAIHRGVNVVSGTFQPSLSRADTEKPKLPTSNTSQPSTTDALATAAQFASLMEQLNKAKQEVETERARLRETEDLLVQERVKREDAEERAKRLESQKLLVPPPPAKPEDATTPIDDVKQDLPKETEADVMKLQERFDLLLAEFNEYKIAAEQWRAEKELAEKERDEERQQRLTLAEMIEKIKSEEASRSPKRKSRGRRRSRSKSSDTSPSLSHDGAKEDRDIDAEAVDVEQHHSNGSIEKTIKAATANGHPFAGSRTASNGPNQSDTQRNTLVRRDLQLTEAAPYLSAISVVMIGVAVMALLNKMQRGESIKS